MNRKEIQEKLNNPPKPKYLYQRYNGKINKYELNGNILINVYNPNITIDRNRHLIYGKTSENIVDLIEEGDYVNGHLVLKKEDDNFLLIDDKGYAHLAPINIKSIVTKEQFKRVKYEV